VARYDYELARRQRPSRRSLGLCHRDPCRRGHYPPLRSDQRPFISLYPQHIAPFSSADRVENPSRHTAACRVDVTWRKCSGYIAECKMCVRGALRSEGKKP